MFKTPTATMDQDPQFYESKPILRRAFPDADLIELAEGYMTVISNGVTLRLPL